MNQPLAPESMQLLMGWSDRGRWFSKYTLFCRASLHHLLRHTLHILLLIVFRTAKYRLLWWKNTFVFSVLFFFAAKKLKAGNTPTGKPLALSQAWLQCLIFKCFLNVDMKIHLRYGSPDLFLIWLMFCHLCPQRRPQPMTQISLNPNAELISSNVGTIFLPVF